MSDDQTTDLRPRGNPLMSAYGTGYDRGMAAAIRWLRKHSDAHAGKWMGMEPREAIRAAADAMEDAYGAQARAERSEP